MGLLLLVSYLGTTVTTTVISKRWEDDLFEQPPVITVPLSKCVNKCLKTNYPAAGCGGPEQWNCLCRVCLFHSYNLLTLLLIAGGSTR